MSSELDFPVPDQEEREAIRPRLTVSELVAVYEQAERDIRAGYALVAGAEAKLKETFEMSGVHIYIRGERRREVCFEDPDDTVRSLQRQVWRALVENLELKRFMSVEAWNKLDNQIEKGEVLPINSETVTQMAEGFRRQMPDMLREAVEEVFGMLRPRNDRYRTNSQFEVPAKVILERYVEAGFGSPFRVPYWREQEMTALENVFRALDGHGSVAKGWRSELSHAIETSKDGTGTTPFFGFRACKNGNLHLWLLREDLLAKFNAIAGGKRLRGERKAG